MNQGDLVKFVSGYDPVSGEVSEYSLGILLAIDCLRGTASIFYRGSITPIWLRNVEPI